MAYVGQSDGAVSSLSPGTDGNGTGVPTNNTIANFTQLFSSVAGDVAQTYSAVNQPTSAAANTANPGAGGLSGISLGVGGFGNLLPIILLVAAGWLIFREM